ncbi:hypothetical protein GQ53DRAFT_846017 [Thozetella sp. PMI_491]|nr:hypothetical protein GQ53DRAFT_846017 [Thozetella sp. PMI_491]
MGLLGKRSSPVFSMPHPKEFQSKKAKTSDQVLALPLPEEDSSKKAEASPQVPSTLEEALKEIELLKGNLTAALDFINRQGVAACAPPPIQKLLREQPDANKHAAASITREIGATYEKIMEKSWDKYSGVTSDDVSKAMVPYLAKIEQLSTMSGSDSLRLAYNLVGKLKNRSYLGFDDFHCGYGQRPSDEPADALLVRLMDARRAAGETWDWAGELKALEKQAHHHAEYGVEPWFVKSQARLRNLVEAPAVVNPSQGLPLQDY